LLPGLKTILKGQRIWGASGNLGGHFICSISTMKKSTEMTPGRCRSVKFKISQKIISK
jgi:hypothetical protein